MSDLSDIDWESLKERYRTLGLEVGRTIWLNTTKDHVRCTIVLIAVHEEAGSVAPFGLVVDVHLGHEVEPGSFKVRRTYLWHSIVCWEDA